MSATGDITKRKRPLQSGVPVLVRLQPEQLAQLDAWIAGQPSSTSRPEAIRMILQEMFG